MVSALLGFMAISGLLGQQNLQRINIKFLPVDDLFANLPGRVDVELENRRRWLPAFLLSVEVGTGNTLFPLLPAKRRQRQSLTLVLPERGYQSLPDVWIRSCFPINFFVRSRRLVIAQQLLVFPQPLAAELPFAAGAGHPSRQRETAQPGIDGELRSVDSYRPNDPLKSIHWKLSARQDDFIVKRQSRLGAPALMLDLDDFTGPLEQRLGKCTFLIDRLIAQRRSVGLRLADQQIPPRAGRGQRMKLLSELALYGRR